MPDMIGWFSSFVLFSTIVAQIVKQWREGSSRGGSPWVFAGQTAASLGFTVYSALLRNWFFTVTNGLLLVSAIAGMAITFHFKRRSRESAVAPATP